MGATMINALAAFDGAFAGVMMAATCLGIWVWWVTK